MMTYNYNGQGLLRTEIQIGGLGDDCGTLTVLDAAFTVIFHWTHVPTANNEVHSLQASVTLGARFGSVIAECLHLSILTLHCRSRYIITGRLIIALQSLSLCTKCDFLSKFHSRV